MPVCVSYGKLVFATDPSVDEWLKLIQLRGDYLLARDEVNDSHYISIGGRIIGICSECQQRHENTTMTPSVRAILSDGTDGINHMINILPFV